MGFHGWQSQIENFEFSFKICPKRNKSIRNVVTCAKPSDSVNISLETGFPLPPYNFHSFEVCCSGKHEQNRWVRAEFGTSAFLEGHQKLPLLVGFVCNLQGQKR